MPSYLVVKVFSTLIEQQAQDFHRAKLITRHVSDLTNFQQGHRIKVLCQTQNMGKSASDLISVDFKLSQHKNSTVHTIGAKVTCTRGTHRPLKHQGSDPSNRWMCRPICIARNWHFAPLQRIKDSISHRGQVVLPARISLQPWTSEGPLGSPIPSCRQQMITL